MIRTLLVGAVALDEMIFNERHGSSDSGVFDEAEVVYGENGEVIENLVLKTGNVVPSAVPAVSADDVYVEENELVYGKNGEVTEITENNNFVVREDIEEKEEEVEDESTDENEESIDEDDAEINIPVEEEDDDEVESIEEEEEILDEEEDSTNEIDIHSDNEKDEQTRLDETLNVGKVSEEV